MLPFVHKQLPLSLKAGGHIPPACQRLEPSAENSEKEVPLRRRATAGCPRALLQASSHLLEKARPKRSRTFITYFYRWLQVVVPKSEGRKSSGLTVSPNQDSERRLGGLGGGSQEELGMTGTSVFTWKSLKSCKNRTRTVQRTPLPSFTDG